MGNVNLPIHDFNVGDPIYLHALIEVLDNADYDDGYFGTMSVRFELRDEAGVLVYVLSGSMHNGISRVAPEELWITLH